MNARTIFPSVTLPCHMSMFHSVPAERHGITWNRYNPPARPLNGLFEQIKAAGKTSAMFYGWEPLRDISRPYSLIAADYQNWRTAENVDRILTNKAMACIDELHPDFVFLYMVGTGGSGHDSGCLALLRDLRTQSAGALLAGEDSCDNAESMTEAYSFYAL